VIVTSIRYTQAVSDQAGITIRIDPTEIVGATGNGPEMRILGNLKLVGIRHCSPDAHWAPVSAITAKTYRVTTNSLSDLRPVIRIPKNRTDTGTLPSQAPEGIPGTSCDATARDLATVHFPLTATLFLVLNSGAVPGIAYLRYRRDSRYQVRRILSGVPEPSPDPASACAVRHLGRLCLQYSYMLRTREIDVDRLGIQKFSSRRASASSFDRSRWYSRRA
jgi:hypothetical protein